MTEEFANVGFAHKYPRKAQKTAVCAGILTIAILALTACSTDNPGGIEVRTVEVPVPQPCLPADQIPAEPAKVNALLNGVASHDLSIVAASALELRAWGEEMHAALVACAG